MIELTGGKVWLLPTGTDDHVQVTDDVMSYELDGELRLAGLDLADTARDALFNVDLPAWRAELDAIGQYLGEFAPRLPEALRLEQRRVADALAADATPAREAAATA